VLQEIDETRLKREQKCFAVEKKENAGRENLLAIETL
jgi:hypothetical protein